MPTSDKENPMRIATVLLAASTLLSAPAFAGEKCPYQPRDKWMPIDQAIRKAESFGYAVREVEADDRCWKVEGFDRNGARIKLVLDPVTGEVVKPAAWLPPRAQQ
ncbi:hypothetical protein GCM10023144_12510 [Pigmentiphaga soli]|uniref:PepSY domain-containing protein n=1 Tax=Pigmentiphaga soli TaxID=1007095 RepID=A0ABP8GNT3_9BURK